MKHYKIVISRDGKKFLHTYSDALIPLDESLGEFNVNRASDVYFCNDRKKWKVKFLSTGDIAPPEFDTREEALDWEHSYLQDTLRIV